MRHLLFPAFVAMLTACDGTDPMDSGSTDTARPPRPESTVLPDPLPGTPVAFTERSTGDGGTDNFTEGDCREVVTERFASMEDAKPYIEEHLPYLDDPLDPIPVNTQLVVALSPFCSTGGHRLSVIDVREVDGSAHAYLRFFHPAGITFVTVRPFVMFTIPADYANLELVVAQDYQPYPEYR